MKRPDNTVWPAGPDRRDAPDSHEPGPDGAAQTLRARDLQPLLALINQAAPLCATRLASGDPTAVRIEVMPVPGLGEAAYLIVLSPGAQPARAATVATTGPARGPVSDVIPDEINVVPSDPRLLALGLTPRQADIVARLVLGHSNKAIARTLDIAPATVKKHLEDTYRRLGVRNRTEAALAARAALSA